MSVAQRIRVVAAVVRRGGEVLLTQRPPGGRHALLWEFPGGKLEPGESVAEALVREIDEELGVRASAAETLAIVRHDYPGGPEVEVHFVRCALAPATLKPGRGVHAMRWVRPRDIDTREVLEADRGFIARLAAQDEAG